MNSKYMKCIASISMVVALVTGCASSNISMANRPYNPSISQAKNIGDMFGYNHWRDQRAPDGFTDTSILTDTIFNASALDAAYGSPFLPGVDGLSALGFGLLLSVGQSMKKEFWEVHSSFGFVPVKVAPTPEKASEYLVDNLEKAFVKAVKNHFPEYTVETFDPAWRKPTSGIFGWNLRSYVRIVHLVNPKQGCFSTKDYEQHKEGMCWVKLNSGLPTEQISLPAAAGTSGELVWRISQKAIFEEDILSGIDFNHGSDVENMIEPTTLLPQVAKYMPKYTYIYLAPSYNYTKSTPPIIFDGNRTMFFVKPKNN